MTPTAQSAAAVRFVNDEAAALLKDHLPRLAAPTEDQWQLIKRNPSRSVYRGTVGRTAVYLKHFHSRGLWRRLTRAVGFSRAMREFNLARYLDEHSVAATPVLAAACGGGVEWVVSCEVADAEPGDSWHESRFRRHDAKAGDEIRHVTEALAEMVGRMHQAGVIHRDLHCGNILVRQKAERTQLVLMDLHRASRRRLSRRDRAMNLAQLFCDRRDFSTRSQRLRFLKRYLAVSAVEGTLRGWTYLIEEFAERHAHRILTGRDRRILGTNRYFAVVRLSGGWRGHVVLASKRKMPASQVAGVTFRRQDWLDVLEDPEALLTGPDVEVLKDSRSSLVVRREVSVGGHRVMMHIKRPRRKRAWKLVIDCFRRSRPVRAFKLGHMLLTRRIPTAVPLAALSRRVGPVLTDSILITETVQCPRLHDFFNSHLARPPSGQRELTGLQQRQLAQDVLAEMGRLLQRLHDYKFAHRDLKANNMLVYWQADEPPQIVLVDLDGLRPVWHLTDRRRFQGLMRLNVSLLKCPIVNHAGQLRMLMGYLRRPGSGRINFKPYWRVLEDWSARKLRQQIRSRRKDQVAVRHQVQPPRQTVRP